MPCCGFLFPSAMAGFYLTSIGLTDQILNFNANICRLYQTSVAFTSKYRIYKSNILIQLAEMHGIYQQLYVEFTNQIYSYSQRKSMVFASNYMQNLQFKYPRIVSGNAWYLPAVRCRIYHVIKNQPCEHRIYHANIGFSKQIQIPQTH